MVYSQSAHVLSRDWVASYRRLAKIFCPTAACVLLAVAGVAHADPIGSDCRLWLRADQGVTASTGGVVSQWLDQSGMGHHAGNSSGDGPVLISNAVNGRPAMRFAGFNWLSLSGSVITSDRYTIIAVVNDTRQDGSFREIISNWSFSNTLTSVFMGTTSLDPEGPGTTRARLTDDVGGANQGQQGVGAITQRGVHFIMTGISRETNAEVYQNRALIAGRETPISARNFSTPWVIGRQGPISEFWVGDIAEILVYNRDLSRCELDLVYDDLNARYATAPCSPTIAQNPPTRSVCPGGLAEMSATAGGGTCESNFTYRWQRADPGVPGGWVDLADGPLMLAISGAPIVVSTISGSSTPNLSERVAGNVRGIWAGGERRLVVTNACGSTPSLPARLVVLAPCSPADVANTDGLTVADGQCPDGMIDNGDFGAFFEAFFLSLGDPRRLIADIANTDGDTILSGGGPDATVDNGDFSAFFTLFFEGCSGG